MAINDVTKKAVLKALAECEEVGEQPFLERYGYGKALEYHLSYEGKSYPSKAIFGVAHGYSKEGLKPLKFNEFSGGEQQVAGPLRKLGFEVTGNAARNPKWSIDELILTLRVYKRFDGNPPGKTSEDILNLSSLLNHLGETLGTSRAERFRNPNGVYMKLMNFRRFDQKYISQGKKGLTSGGKAEGTVWIEYADYPAKLEKAAQAIENALNSHNADDLMSIVLDDEIEAPEGKLLTRIHRFRERNQAIVRKKKAQIQQQTGALACEACGFIFSNVYGDRGAGFIECHHTVPVSEIDAGSKTKLKDLVLLCANCHRMVHSSRPWLSLTKLKKTIAMVRKI